MCEPTISSMKLEDLTGYQIIQSTSADLASDCEIISTSVGDKIVNLSKFTQVFYYVCKFILYIFLIVESPKLYLLVCHSCDSMHESSKLVTTCLSCQNSTQSIYWRRKNSMEWSPVGVAARIIPQVSNAYYI